ncbi:MAG TPA: DUF1223 domain-containing protein, partial [Thermoanaerobaculia bacterium]|nr:DUF1223 domain-containing protein [Thermoanaerobaculia bacterium]
TSQGCSSCPPADRLLSELGSNPRWQGKVLPLAYHVDYWDHLGWADPFSSPTWSARQEAYARARGTSRIYTPQLMVHGLEDCLGSDRSCIERALRRLLSEPAKWQVEVAPGEPKAGRLTAVVDAHPTAAGASTKANLLAAVVENGFSTAVARGENARRQLDNDFVVRRLAQAKATPGKALPVSLELESGWKRENLRLVVFVQEPETLEILGAAELPRAQPATGG